jgi:hypothetical protein
LKNKVKLPAHRAGHLKNRLRGIASPLPLLRIHPRPQDGVFCGEEFINWKEGLKMGFVIGILVVVALVFGIVYLVQRT